MQYLAMYVYGMFKSSVISPPVQASPTSVQLDNVNFLNYQINNFSPEEVLPIFYPQVYDISDPYITAEEFPPVSHLEFCLIFCVDGNAKPHDFQADQHIPHIQLATGHLVYWVPG